MSEGLWPATTFGHLRLIFEDFGIEPYEFVSQPENYRYGSAVIVVVHEQDVEQARGIAALIELPVGARIEVWTRAEAIAKGRP
jgi:hypothetical protein